MRAADGLTTPCSSHCQRAGCYDGIALSTLSIYSAYSYYSLILSQVLERAKAAVAQLLPKHAAPYSLPLASLIDELERLERWLKRPGGVAQPKPLSEAGLLV